MKKLTSASVVALLVLASPTYASHDLAKPPAEQAPVDNHISWHEFRHELGSYPGVTATIDHHGVITLAGHTDSSPEKQRISNLATQVRGTIEVNNLIGTD
ncbi:hypothetical protein [Granulosicoccus antarcticus]|uniref:BON domain-containing protein n=1 Tax=Granulosicoccus antarcticus IMCC3135 TaxID=1192854 RepID=A0A2Z2NQE1_9GAMM|nr:hypothetical protein [Granulosicoccus antarcticus]ASJ73706.1 hypothetical protein IMCC3135_18135 [Granulosicoccus antarcticus IMCC3135]